MTEYEEYQWVIKTIKRYSYSLRIDNPNYAPSLLDIEMFFDAPFYINYMRNFTVRFIYHNDSCVSRVMMVFDVRIGNDIIHFKELDDYVMFKLRFQ